VVALLEFYRSEDARGRV